MNFKICLSSDYFDPFSVKTTEADVALLKSLTLALDDGETDFD